MADNTITQQVEWGDCDSAGIVFYPNFYRWMDRAAWALLAANGLTPDVMRDRWNAPFGTPLVETWAKYLSPARFADVLTIESGVSSWQRKTFKIGHRFRRAELAIAEGYEIRIWGQPDAQDPTRIRAGLIPGEVREALSSSSESDPA